MNRRPARVISLFALLIATFGLVASAFGLGAVVTEGAPGSPSAALMPGSETTHDLVMGNASTTTASLHVQARDVSEDDDGCVRPEQQAGDVTCGEGGGELGRWLRLRVLLVGAAEDQELWAGSLDELQTGVDLLGDVAAGDTPRLRLVVALSRDASNDTMSDRVTFVLRSTYTGVLAPTESTVVSVGAPHGQGGGHTHGPLPATGSSISLPVLVLATGLAAVGAMMIAHRRNRSGRRR